MEISLGLIKHEINQIDISFFKEITTVSTSQSVLADGIVT